MARTPIHPGEILADELEELGVSPTELSRQIRVPANRISQIINSKRSITGDTALRLAAAVLSWLLAFNVLNSRNQVVYAIADFLYRITEPALRPIRRFVPQLGGIDVSPVVLILLLIFAQNLIYEYWL